MIKKIIEKIKSWFRPKEQMDPHEVMLHPRGTPFVDEHNKCRRNVAKQKKIRLKHSEDK